MILEKETSEAASRAKRQELEEKLTLQEALLERERRGDQQQKLITALAADYWSVYYLELDRDEGVCYQSHEDLNDGFRPGDRFRYLESVTAYANRYIALTANAFDEDVQRSLQAGLNAHLSKPIEPESLFGTLESLIK